jgi:hypothetical protein
LVFLYVHHQEAIVTWLEATSSLRRGGFVVSLIRRKCIISK